MRASTLWDDVEHLVLSATRQPATARQVAARTGLTPDLAQAQLEVLQRDGFLAQSVDAGVRYQLTLTGRKRLSALTTRPGHPAAA
ncbi:hypothetical protein AB0K34_14060 [Actinomadura sp. NPDC049382]|uniref:hypothetical protein n=1 Tax=Actinomadura sp. NPDC049382 TaxID=3158220 RepID=UPI0034173A24